MGNLDRMGQMAAVSGIVAVPALGADGWQTWELISASAFVTAGAYIGWPGVRVVLGSLFTSPMPYYEIRPARVADAEAIHALGVSSFGTGVTGKAQILSFIRQCRSMFFVFERRSLDRTHSEIAGYGCIIPISHLHTRQIEDRKFSIAELTPVHLPRGRANVAAIYIGAIVGRGKSERGKLLGYLEAVAGEQARKTRTKTVYAKAVTDDGLRILNKKGFLPVDPSLTGIGAFFSTTVH